MKKTLRFAKPTLWVRNASPLPSIADRRRARGSCWCQVCGRGQGQRRQSYDLARVCSEDARAVSLGALTAQVCSGSERG